MARINVIHGGNLEAFNMLAYPDQHPSNHTYLNNQLQNYSQTVTDIGRSFMEKSQDIYRKLNDSTAIRAAKAALRMAKGVFHPNKIVELTTLDEVRSSQPLMQRYVMACPEIREIYHRQLCDGYSDTYVDLEHGLTGPSHYDYRRVMSTMIEELDDGEDWHVTMFSEELRPGDQELEFEERVDVRNTWDLVRMFITEGEDPTDVWGGKLGSV